MVVNDDAYELDKRGALESIASKPAPTVSRDCVKNQFFPDLCANGTENHSDTRSLYGRSRCRNVDAFAMSALHGCKVGRVAWKIARCSSSLQVTCSYAHCWHGRWPRRLRGLPRTCC
ncbi:hypothetical protein CRX42_33520 [Pseudomonas jessenii]|uniref:Uncharacterized protein n=1 Tax=Pseudomonas jessenii TaxID=77298 RepID=A0A2W0EAJ8_PSEJE|nr:hypothetical protein CRX42_33520 [Pseudomonas jessenii]